VVALGFKATNRELIAALKSRPGVKLGIEATLCDVPNWILDSNNWTLENNQRMPVITVFVPSNLHPPHLYPQPHSVHKSLFVALTALC
jgi:hypothetical protein